MSGLGVVIIGRNEGDRLPGCVRSVMAETTRVVYVDSGSADTSVAVAEGLGAETIELDCSTPFTAARARNAGVEALLRRHPQLQFVQFIDGDCELIRGWLTAAERELMNHPDVAVACGRRRELQPARSIYNTICDMEWDGVGGDVTACGGDALMRVEALTAVHGFDATLIAGEEPDLCLRLRRRGWRIVRLDVEMTRHDAEMLYLNQWWRRTVRAGHAYAEGAWRHWSEPERFWLRETASLWFWGAVLPALALGTAHRTDGSSLALLGGYMAVAGRIFRRTRRRGYGKRESALYAIFCMLGKFAQVQGALMFLWRQATHTRPTLIEYRGA